MTSEDVFSSDGWQETLLLMVLSALKYGDRIEKPLPIDHRRPVVLLIGWAGAEHEHLAKYSSIYNEQGYRTIAFIAPCYRYTVPNARCGFYLSPVLRGIDAKPGNFESFRHW
ncbi:hypothetical protein NECAME_05266 [Necator americanus]|uniref:Transmembrane protein 53 n=1 Tax=Necator americanus TaxID=51031 RepID=W2SKN0_NECAM|nr:hypothetical protein NECAME_05266 [Necator americanus]ETN69411.1 hypothetical protein NECAME_05266 [Necator americanus]